jgi:hypothetical protein
VNPTPADPGKRARHLHDVAAGLDPRAARVWPSGPVGDALWAIVGRLNVIQHECAREGTSLLLTDPRDLASVIERLGKAAQLEGFTGTFEQAGAYAIAAWVAASRAEAASPFTGDAA